MKKGVFTIAFAILALAATVFWFSIRHDKNTAAPRNEIKVPMSGNSNPVISKKDDVTVKVSNHEINPAEGNQNSSESKAPNTESPKIAKKKGKTITDPMARTALSLVGVDPEAEEYWLAAINDPNLPPGERQDLIEDLNEEGFADPKHPTVEDLPLIEERMNLILNIQEDAMDDVNAAAFREAYKDLENMYARLTQ